MKFKGVYLASDFDNTMLQTSNIMDGEAREHIVPQRNLDALAYFLSEGGSFGIATGRVLTGFGPYRHLVPYNMPTVLSNGVCIYDYDKEEVIYESFVHRDCLALCQEVLDHFPNVACEFHHDNDTVHVIRPNEVTKIHQKITGFTMTLIDDPQDAVGNLSKLLFEGSREDLEEVEQYLKGKAAGYTVTFSATYLLELMATGVSKGEAVRILAEKRGFSMEHVYCVGDECNDIPMLQAASQGFAPSNCIPAIRDMEDVKIVYHCADGAIADVIAILDQKY